MSILKSIIAVLLILFSSLTLAQSDDDQYLWVVRDSQVFKLNSADGTEILAINDEDNIRAIVSFKNMVFRYGNGFLSATTDTGENLFRNEVNLDGNEYEKTILEIERDYRSYVGKMGKGKIPYTYWRKNAFIECVGNNVWLAAGNALYLYDLKGVFQRKISISAAARSVSLDRAREWLWVATSHSVQAFSKDGKEQKQIDLGKKARIGSISYAKSLDEIWVAKFNGIFRYSINGLKKSGNALFLIQQIASDNQGGLWAVGYYNIFRLDANENSEKPTVTSFKLRLGRLFDLAIQGETVWLAAKRSLRQYSKRGERLQDLRYKNRRETPIRALALQERTNAPELVIVSPKENQIISSSTPTVEFSYQSPLPIDKNSLSININGSDVTKNCNYSDTNVICNITEELAEGPNSLVASIADEVGNQSEAVRINFTVELEPFMEITINAPADGVITTEMDLQISGSLNKNASLGLAHKAKNYVNTETISVDSDLKFGHQIKLVRGQNTLTLTAEHNGEKVERVVTVTYDPIPTIPDGSKIKAISKDGKATVVGSAGSVDPDVYVVIIHDNTGNVVPAQANGQGEFEAVIDAGVGNTLTIVTQNANKKESKPTVITVQGEQKPDGDLPPDPIDIAPPVDSGVSTNINDSTIFIYEGDNPIQVGVEPGTIEAKRTALLRGKVTDINNTAISGVTITILHHNEFGQTKTRTDGLFDMVVNGGGYLTIQYTKEGFPPIQRKMMVPWQDYVVLPDVVMLPFDEKVTTIGLTDNTKTNVAQSSVVSDKDGERQGTVFFPPGTTATISLKNGTTKQLSSMNVRITEFTVGDSGSKAMPAELPPSTKYTYAIELTADEVLNEGVKTNGKDVVFNQPVPYYVDNFLEFPTGTIVPAGYYDSDHAAWIAADNGRVIEILSITEGAADIDIDGDKSAEDNDALTSFGITEKERTLLASLFAVGKTLWRVPLAHFSTYDFNYGAGAGGGGPGACTGECKPPAIEPEKEKHEPDPDCENGSLIHCQSQVLGEEIPIAGVPWSIHYTSNRVPGRKTENTIKVPLTGITVPSNLLRIKLEINIAGRRFQKEFDPLPNQKYTFVWDGKDAYNRVVSGAQKADVKVGHVYDGYYYLPPNVSRSFGYPLGELKLSDVKTREPLVFWQKYQVNISFYNRGSSFGSWSVGIRHNYDIYSNTLLQGDGGRVTSDSIGYKIVTAAGTGEFYYDDPGDGGLATEAGLAKPYSIAIGQNGNLYIVHGPSIRMVNPDGIITTIAGNGGSGYSGDGGPAIEATLNKPAGVAVGHDGSIYFADSNRVRRVNVDGIISTVAGTGDSGYSEDGGLATNAKLDPAAIAVGQDGALYIADSNRIRRVSADGIITTIPAGDAGVIHGIAIGQHGDVYFADTYNHRIRKINVDGVTTTVAGSDVGYNAGGYWGDGGLAIDAYIDTPMGIAIGEDGSLFIAGSYNNVIRRVSSDGIITTVAGNGRKSGSSGDGGLATDALLNDPWDIAVGNDGSLYIADTENNKIRRVHSEYGEFSVDALTIPSTNGRELYLFDADVRHLSTINAITGSVIYEFGYNINGDLESIKDKDNNISMIERSGNQISIIAPRGQKTLLTLNAEGYLESSKNPANETIKLTYHDGGLLESLTDAKQQDHQYRFDEMGRLSYDENPAGGSWSLERKALDDGYQVTKTSKLGRATTYKVDNSDFGKQTRIVSYPDGTKKETVRDLETYKKTVSSSDGTVVITQKGADPRFGMVAAYTKEAVVKTPQNLEKKVIREKAVELDDKNDFLSLKTLTTKTTINNRIYQSNYDAPTKIFTTTSPEKRITTTVIDEKGRLLREAAPELASTFYEYHTTGELKSLTIGEGTTARSYNFEINPQGFVKSIADPEKQKVDFTSYDLVGRLKESVLPGNRTITFDHDANGNMTHIAPPGRPAHQFDYTPIDFPETYIPPNVVDVGNRTTDYLYSKDKELELETRPDGKTIDYVYNQITGQLNDIVFPRGTISFGYKQESGQIERIDSPGGITLSFTYDGFLPKSESWSGPISGIVERGYENNFWTNSITVNSDKIEFGYDNDGLLTSAGDLVLHRNPSNGLLEGSDLGKVKDQWQYNQFGEPTSYSVTFDSNEILRFDYAERDKLGRIKKEEQTISGVTHKYEYNYAAAGYLDTVYKDGILVSNYDLDQNGNRKTHSTPQGIANGEYDDQDRLEQYGNYRFVFGANGELKEKISKQDKSTTKFDYGVFGRLHSATLSDGTLIEYIIDGRDRVIGKKVNGQLVKGLLYRDSLNPVAELDKSGNVVARFVYGIRSNVPEYMIKNGTTFRIISDRLGSPILVVDVETGNVVQQMGFDEFGNVVKDSNPGFQPFGYAGGIYDSDTKLVRFGARDYDSETGRWTTKDPIRFDGDGTNLYLYTQGDAINRIDPLGTDDIDVQIALTLINKQYSGLKTPDQVYFSDFMFFPGSPAAMTNPITKNITLNSNLFYSLDGSTAFSNSADFLWALTHEVLHYNDSRWDILFDGLSKHPFSPIPDSHEEYINLRALEMSGKLIKEFDEMKEKYGSCPK